MPMFFIKSPVLRAHMIDHAFVVDIVILEHTVLRATIIPLLSFKFFPSQCQASRMSFGF